MYEDFFPERLSSLRLKKNVSAREMSLAIGQNGSYINRIENKLALPSLSAFFYICEYLEISPKDFFDVETLNPFLLNEIIAELKGKNSTNVESISYVAKYSSEKLEKSTAENVVSALYVAPKVVAEPQAAVSSRLGTVNTSQKVSYERRALGISIARPVSGTITSPFGRRSRGIHTGLDIATTKGTPIGAAAAGTVTYAARKGTYGNLVVIDHGNGIQTYYAHCNSINCSVGQKVSQGQMISTVGTTGNSTGSHLHLEIRINGICYNPKNYLY